MQVCFHFATVVLHFRTNMWFTCENKPSSCPTGRAWFLFFEFSSAFNTIQPPILSGKLESMDVVTDSLTLRLNTGTCSPHR